MRRSYWPALLTAIAICACLLSPARAASTVELASHSPRFTHNILDGLDNDPAIMVPALFSLPDGEGRVPAMVIVHGSGGIGARGAEYQDLLNAMGIATLRPDSFGPRGVKTTVGNQGSVTTFSMVADAFAALRFLAAHPRIDPDRIGIMGFSKGGSTAHFTAFEPLRAAAMQGPEKFALHIPFYRACLYDVAMALTGAPVRELLGADDDYSGAAGCVDYAAMRKAEGRDYEAIVYPHAHHGFNSDFPPFHCYRCISYAACDLRIDSIGRVTDKHTNTVLTSANQRELLGACTHAGTTVGGDPSASAQSRQFVQDFLRERFRLR